MTPPSVESTPTVLVVDDEDDLRLVMRMTLRRMGVQCLVAANVSEAQQCLKQQSVQLCLTDLNLPGESGLDLVRWMVQYYPQVPVAVISAYGNMDVAIAALKAGAFDFVNKPIQPEQLKALLTHAVTAGSQPISQLDLQIEDQLLIGQSEVMQQLKMTLRKLSRSHAPVFITGESGSGKEVVARLIHQMSNRNEGPFVPVNCGAIPPELMESEFFGHKKGSFTGAHQDKTGLFQAADGGTLFLDEIADLPLSMQVKLLRAIQEKKVRPLGGQKEISVDCRILSATHKNLAELVQQGKFREDLYFRIHVIEAHIPPLRDRKEDIILLAEHFLQHIIQEWHLPPLQLSEEARALLLTGDYRGNVRELRNLMERAVTLCDGPIILAEHIQGLTSPTGSISSNASHAGQTPANRPASTHLPFQTLTPALPDTLPHEGLEDYLATIEKNLLIKALEATHWNRTLAAKKLGMSFRSLRYRLKKFGLDHDDDSATPDSCTTPPPDI